MPSEEQRDRWELVYQSKSEVDLETEEFIANQRIQRHYLLKKHLLPMSGVRVLEAGCGKGEDLSKLFDKNVSCVGIDYSREAIRSGKTKYPFIDFILGDILNLPFKNNNFDLVFNSGVIEHFRDPANSLYEMKRVTKDKGFVLVFVPNMFSLWTLYRHITNSLPRISKRFHGWPVWERSFNFHNLKKAGHRCFGKSGEIEVKGITLLYFVQFVKQSELTIGRGLLPSFLETKMFSLFKKLDKQESQLSKIFGMELVLISKATKP